MEANPIWLDALAERVVDLLCERLEIPQPSEPQRLVDASELAGLIGFSREWVYDHRADLGVVAIGNGTRPRLRFDPEKAREYLAACSPSKRPDSPEKPAGEPKRARPRRRASGTRTELLPIKGSEKAKSSP